jgi:hypothetical protein
VATHERALTRQAIEETERRLARVYAVIDRGNDVGDLTAPGAVKMIEEMDRLGLTMGMTKYLTYPEDAGDGERGGNDEAGDLMKTFYFLDEPAASGGKRGDNEGDDSACDTALALARAEGFPLVRARTTGLVSSTATTRRPERKIEYDDSLGVGPEPRVADEVKDAELAQFDARGELSSVAYRDLECID